MDEYTIKDVIIDYEDPRVEEAIGKEVYFSEGPWMCLYYANSINNDSLGILDYIGNGNLLAPFHIKSGTSWQCIIIKKNESSVSQKKNEDPYLVSSKKWIEDNNLEVGDYVKVLRKTEPYENKWRSFWVDEMSDYIGKALKVLAINSLRGLISLECDDTVYDFPYFVLEKAEKPESQYVPFESKEEFIEAFQYHDNANYSETEDILLNYGMWLWSNENGSYKLVTEIWNAGVVIGDNKMRITNEEGHIDAFNDTTSWVKLFSEYRFLDGTPCGKLEKEDQ